MRIRLRSQLDIINVVLLLLAITLFCADQYAENLQIPGERLFSLKAAEVKEIRISKDNRLRLSFTKGQNSWRLNYPHKAPVEDKKVGILLSLLSAKSTLNLAKNKQNLTDFGLNAHGLEIRFNQETLQFGEINSVSGKRYALHNKTIALLDEAYYLIANLSAKNYSETP